MQFIFWENRGILISLFFHHILFYGYSLQCILPSGAFFSDEVGNLHWLALYSLPSLASGSLLAFMKKNAESAQQEESSVT